MCFYKPSNVANEFSFWRYWCVVSSAILNFKLVSLEREGGKRIKQTNFRVQMGI